MRAFPFCREAIERVLEEDGWSEIIKVHDSYTGRGLRAACVGFEAPEVRNVAAFLVRLAGETEAEGVELEDLVEVTTIMCSDGMGKNNVIVYFPNYVLLDGDGKETKPTRRGGNSVTGSVTGSLVQIANAVGEVRINR